MFRRLYVQPVDLQKVRVVFNEDGRDRDVLVEDMTLATAVLTNARDLKVANSQCQEACAAAEGDFNRLAQEAEAVYKATTDRLRAEADVKIKAAQERQITETAALSAARLGLDEQAFRKAEVQLIQAAKK